MSLRASPKSTQLHITHKYLSGTLKTLTKNGTENLFHMKEGKYVFRPKHTNKNENVYIYIYIYMHTYLYIYMYTLYIRKYKHLFYLFLPSPPTLFLPALHGEAHGGGLTGLATPVSTGLKGAWELGAGAERLGV